MMGIDYAIACKDCKEFLNLHKWSPINLESDAFRGKNIFSGNRTYYLARLSVKHVLAKARLDENHLKSLQFNHWVLNLLPLVYQFCDTHGKYFLFVVNDMAGKPWSFYEPGFPEWKETHGPMELGCHFLPRNLIEDEGVLTPNEVVTRLREADDGLYFDSEQDEEYYVRAFEIALRNVNRHNRKTRDRKRIQGKKQ